MPSLAGFLLAALTMFFFVRRRFGTLAAGAAAATPALTGAAIYAYEGRPYGLMLGLAGAAILAWQGRRDARWRSVAPLLSALALAAGALTHYYFGLVLLPLAAGEAVRSWRNRRVDWPIVIAFGGALVPLVADSVIGEGDPPLLLLAPPVEQFLKERPGTSAYAILDADGALLHGAEWLAGLPPAGSDAEVHSEEHAGTT